MQCVDPDPKSCDCSQLMSPVLGTFLCTPCSPAQSFCCWLRGARVVCSECCSAESWRSAQVTEQRKHHLSLKATSHLISSPDRPLPNEEDQACRRLMPADYHRDSHLPATAVASGLHSCLYNDNLLLSASLALSSFPDTAPWIAIWYNLLGLDE